ncbi:unnamed protein product [Rotaria sp. Silwood2]|nr:unnamed protein product [Rotaria sp. Silwood2]
MLKNFSFRTFISFLEVFSVIPDTFSSYRVFMLMTTPNIDVDNELNDGQGHWYTQLSITQVATGQETSLKQQPQKTSLPKQKKKSRGNRSEQHFRRRLRRRNLDEATKALLIEKRMEHHRIIHNNEQLNERKQTDEDMSVPDDDEQIQEWSLNGHTDENNILKRKRYATNSNYELQINKSLSQLSISQQCSKKAKKNNPSDNKSSTMFNKQDHQQQQQHGSSFGITSTLLPRYLTVSDQTFKQLFSSTVENANLIIQWLDTNEKLKSTRQLAHVVNMLQYLNLQKSLWQAYYDVGMTEGGWTTHIPRYVAKEHSTCATYGRSRKFVEQRLVTIEHQLKRTENELQQLLLQLPEWTDKAQPSINSIALSTCIEALVNNGQKHLREEFKYREIMLKIDVNDHHLITAVYNLQPNEKQIAWMKTYWKETAAELHALEEVEILRKRVSLQRLSPSFDNLVDQSTESLQTMLSRPIINSERRAILASRCSKAVTQYKFEMMTLNILAAEDSIRGQKQAAVDAKTKLLLLDVDLNLSLAQTAMLIKGIKYITPCQSQFSKQSIDDIVRQQYTRLSSNVQRCLDDHGEVARQPEDKEAFPALKYLLYELQSKPLPHKLQIRARRECVVMTSIVQLLCNRPDLIIRRTDKSKVLYIGNALEFASKASEYMIKTNAYRELTNDHCPLSDTQNVVTSLLKYLLRRGAINEYQHKKMTPKKNDLELAHLYFIPKPHKLDCSLRPITAAIHAPTTMMSKFLNDLLAPVFIRVARKTTFINGFDLIRTLEKYASDGCLKPNTLFITFDITNLYTMIPRQGTLEAFKRFLERHLKRGKIGTLSIDDLMRMAHLVLDTNVFVYEGKYYKQVRGGAMGSAFTQTLANIYMFEWEHELSQRQISNDEIYGRYIDDAFMTTNLSQDQIKIELEKAAKKDSNIEITYTIASCIDFLDVVVNNNNGQLITSIYHKPAAEPYILPYTSDHPRHVHRNIPYAALLRAARICSNIDDFDMERVRIDMSLLLNDYPPDFILKHFLRFFQWNNALSVLQQLDVKVYHDLHQVLLYQPTRREKELLKMKSIEDGQIPVALSKNKPWDPNILYIPHRFESGPQLTFKRQFRSWWKKFFRFYSILAIEINQHRQRQNPSFYQKKQRQRRRRTPQEQEEWHKRREEQKKQHEEKECQQRLQDFVWRQCYDSDFEEKLQDFEHLDEYYQDLEPKEEKQVKELEQFEQLQIQQLDHDYNEQLKEIYLFEQEKMNEEQQHYCEMQNQLEHLEQQENL